MIGSLSGKVIRIDGITVLFEVGGVGYEVDLPMSSLARLQVNNSYFLYVHHVQREDAQLLFGFLTVEERSLFRTLIKVNGLGPKMALAVLSTFSVADFTALILNEQSKSLEQIPGVGKKTASRMVVELKDRLKNFSLGSSQNPSVAGPAEEVSDSFAEALSAMTALGYREVDALKWVKAVVAKDPSLSTQQIIVAALSLVSSRG